MLQDINHSHSQQQVVMSNNSSTRKSRSGITQPRRSDRNSTNKQHYQPPPIRSTSGSGLRNVNKHHVRYTSGGHLGEFDNNGQENGCYYDNISNGLQNQLGNQKRASSSSSLLSEGHDSDYDHLYSYSSHLDLFEHQLFKAATRRSISGQRLNSGSGQRLATTASSRSSSQQQQQQQPSNNHVVHHHHNTDFDLMMETQLLMQRTNQLVGLQNRQIQPNTTSTSGSGVAAASAAVTTKARAATDQEWVI